MSLVDGFSPQSQELQDSLRQRTGDVPWWGFTGPPGVGKSTLIDVLLSKLRERGRRIGVVAVDPTSPLSDGALLGDRVRMMRHATDPDVFIRSLATHRREGGLSDAVLHCARLMEWSGYDPVLIETVGVGQNEVDIATVADICVVILGPGYGDDVQLIKAGLLEVAGVVVVNKCDLPEAQKLLKEVRAEVGQPGVQGKPPIEVVPIEAKNDVGVDELLDRLLELDTRARNADQRGRHRHRRLRGEIKRQAMLKYEQALDRGLASAAAATLVARVERGELSLDAAVEELGAGG